MGGKEKPVCLEGRRLVFPSAVFCFLCELGMRLSAQNHVGGEVFKVKNGESFEIGTVKSRRERANHENIKRFLDCIENPVRGTQSLQ